MNSRAFRPKDLDAALMYAPPWARDPEPEPEPEPESTAEADDIADADDLAEMGPEEDGEADDTPSFLGDRAMVDLRRRLSLDPEIVPPPPILLEERPSMVRIAARLCAVTAVAALVAWVVVSYSRLRLRAHEIAHSDISSDIASAAPGSVKLVHVHTSTPDPAGEPADGPAAGPAAVHAFAAEEKAPAPAAPSAETPQPVQQPGVSVAVETPAPATAWPSPPQQAREQVAVQTPAPADGWPSPPQQPGESIAVQTPAPPPPPPPAAVDTTRPTLDADEIAVLLNRGKAFLHDGDVVSARLALRRAAEAGSAEAALALGASFDPLVIKQTGAVGVKADAEQARQWYQKAAALGSNVASRQLANLENASR
jgi:hypothetical protein